MKGSAAIVNLPCRATYLSLSGEGEDNFLQPCLHENSCWLVLS